jgi:hypothetical protein
MAEQSAPCRHSWVAGMMYVHDEDLVTIAAMRPVECERCETVIGPDTADDVVSAYAYGEA